VGEWQMCCVYVSCEAGKLCSVLVWFGEKQMCYVLVSCEGVADVLCVSVLQARE
jgi:hypothetical protein